ncbi:ankyrin repeat and SAM domain-containing protein 6-like [Haliotis cracherodii]|uniref:ankyrin repeat and SAM domain-containing protein 6-like n=1 Tax=Haliotis cracherodii TaxID=6455 RepID=UPI0039EB0E9C
MERTRQLFIACEQGDVVSVRTLLDDVEVDSVDDDGNTPLQVAAANGHESVVRELIMKGAALDKPNVFGWTPLMQACRYGHSNVVGTLLQNQADINANNRYGASALTLAGRGGHVATVGMLVDYGIDLNGSGGVCEFTPLLAAAQHGHDTVVRFVIDRGCDVNYRTPSTGLTPLMLAALNGHMTTSQILIEQGGDPNLVNVNNKTALAIATIRRKREVRGYLDRKTTNKPEVAPDEVKPDIIDASKHGDMTRIREILDIDLSQRDASAPQDGATPLMFAAMTGRLDIAELLVVRGCDINKQDTISGWTALMQATYHGKKNVAMYLLNCGADVTIQAKNGCTAFDMASLIDDVDTELLRQLAAKAMQVCKADRGKKNWAKQNGNVAATLPPDFSLEDHPKSGLKAWWNRLSNRFRNLKLGRTFNMSNRLAPMPLQHTTSMQDLSTKTPRSPEHQQIQTARVETQKLLDPTQTALSMTSYKSMLLETKKSAALYTLDINPPRSNLTSESLKPVIPPILPAPSFCLDNSPDDARHAASHWHTTKSIEEDGSSTLNSRRAVSSPMKFLGNRSPGNIRRHYAANALSPHLPTKTISHASFNGATSPTININPAADAVATECVLDAQSEPLPAPTNLTKPGDLFTPSPNIPRSQYSSQHQTRLFMPRRKSSTVPTGFRTMSNTTSPNSSTSGSSSITPQRSSHGKSPSSKGSTTSTLTPSPSPTPGKNSDDAGPMLDSLQESAQNDEVSGILKKLSLEKYHPIFEEQEVDMEAFLTLTDDDLKELGISNNESRRQILTAITELNTGKGRERQQFVDTMASFQSTLRERNISDGAEIRNLMGWAMSEDRDPHIPSAKSRSS